MTTTVTNITTVRSVNQNQDLNYHDHCYQYYYYVQHEYYH